MTLQRKTELKRGTSQLKRTPLARGKSAGLSRKGRLKPRSDKRAKFMSEVRAPQVAALVKAGVTCELGLIVDRASALMGGPAVCTKRIGGLHELRKRSAGGSLVNPDNLRPACNRCNGWVEDHPKEAYQLGLVVRQGDTDWERLGKRADP